MLVQFALLTAGMAWFVRRLSGAPFMRAASVSAILMSLVIAADNLWPPGTGIAANYLQACLHTGGVIGSLVGAELALRLTLRWRPWRAALFCAWTAALIVSDKLLVFAYLAPCCIAAWATGRAMWARQPTRIWGVIGLAAAGAVVGFLLDGLIYREQDLLFRVNKWGRTLGLFFSTGGQYALQHLAVVLPFAVAPVVVLLACGLFARRAEPSDGPPGAWARWRRFEARPEAFFLWVYAVSALAGVTLLMALFVYEQTWSFRYLAPVMIWPLIFTAAALCRSRAVAIGSGVIGVVALAETLALGGWRGELTPGPVAWRSAVADCVTSQGPALGLKGGIAAYWSSRPAMIASGWRAQIVQAIGDGRPYEWGNDRFWFTRDLRDPARAAVFNYFVMDGLDGAAIGMRFGPPDKLFACPNGGPDLWVYDDGAQLTRTFLRGLPWAAPDMLWLVPHDHVTLEGSSWRIEPRPGLTQALFGPYVDIKAKRYRLDLSFAPADPADCGRLVQGLHVQVAITANHGGLKLVRQAPLALHRDPGAACTLSGQVQLKGRKAVDVETPIYVGTPAPVLLTRYGLASP
jgi:hypothetical protein